MSDIYFVPKVKTETGYDRLLYAGAGVPMGGIIMWSGAIANIPTGWALCNGQNGTPDLRDRFVVGAGNTYTVAATGGAASVTLSTAQMPSHSHSITGNNSGSSTFAGNGGAAFTSNTQNSGYTGSGSSHENRPPYYAVAFIMKL